MPWCATSSQSAAATPSTDTDPFVGEMMRYTRFAMVDFPPPDGPTSAVTLPAGMSNEMSRSAHLALASPTSEPLPPTGRSHAQLDVLWL